MTAETEIASIVERINLVKTCAWCPEQYIAHLDGKQVGYLRLRDGVFRVDYPSCGDDAIIENDVLGDGEFYDSREREFWLNEAKTAIARAVMREVRAV